MFFPLADDGISLNTLLTALGSAGGGTMAIAFVYLFLSGKVITRRELDWCRQERDAWQQVALRSLQNTERSQAVAEKAATVADAAITQQTRLGGS